MNQIYDYPPNSDYGLDFNYANWSPNTQIVLCNVPWDNTYQDVVKFDSRSALNSWIDNNSGATVVFDNSTYAPVNRPIIIDLPFNQAYKYNYLRVHNPAQPISGDVGKYFYYFITEVEYDAPHTTRIQVQLDVFQTFVYEMTFGNAFIERGHIGIANSKAMDSYGRDYLTTPEGFDTGSDLGIVDRWNHKIADAASGNYAIMVVATVDLTRADMMASQNRLIAATGSPMEKLPNGAGVYFFETTVQFTKFLQACSKFPNITQGIIGVYAVPPLSAANYPNWSFEDEQMTIDGLNATVKRLVLIGNLNKPVKNLKSNWRDTVQSKIPARYRHLTKFLTSPYCMVEMTTSSGTPIIIRPELLDNKDFEFAQIVHIAQPDPKILFIPLHYNRVNNINQTGYDGMEYDGGEWLDFATGIHNLPTFSIVNNGYMSFMNANKNSLSFQQQSADWAQQRALTGNQLSFDQSTMGISSSQAALDTNLGAMYQSGLVNMLGSMGGGIGSMAGSAASGGGVAGVAGNAVGMAMDMASQYANITISANQMERLNQISNNQTGFNRDTNKAYADWATKGDYANTIGALNAKIQDSRMIQPTISGQVGGDAFNLAAYQWGVEARVKMVCGAAMVAIGEHWLRYGYAINRRVRSLPTNLRVMTNFTYWKTQELYLKSSSCPETFRRALVGIFNSGTTVWGNPADIGRIDWTDNEPLPGVTL